MTVLRHRGLLAVGALVALAGCGNGGSEPMVTPSSITAVGGNNQSGSVGQALPSPLVVKVTGSNGSAMSGVSISFAVTGGAASVSPATSTTDASGQAQTQVTFGATPGTVTVSATVVGTQLVATFTLTANAGSTSRACSSASPQTPAVGGVLPDVGGTGICLGGGASGAEYALVPFYSNTDTTTASSTFSTSFTVTSQNATAVTTANLVPSVAPSFSMIPGRVGGVKPRATNDLGAAFDANLREIERRELTPKIPLARAWYRGGRSGAGPSFSIAPPSRPSFNGLPSSASLNQILTLNANGTNACSNPIMIGARVAAMSKSAWVLADTANPAGGFTDAQYQSFATKFDTLINPLDTTNYGAPSDIDHNNVIVILFTKEVNKLTPKTGGSGVIGGFFFARDLFPTQNTPTLQGCASSNVGEMFYVLVPDPTGVFSVAHTTGFVDTLTTGTLAHEYQHLINAARRLYVNTTAQDFEEVWLNEGLSHIAEELLFYRVSGKAPRQNLDYPTFQADANLRAAFNAYQADNFGRYEVFLGKPNFTSVWGDNDSLQTRGATWNMLRYLADHRTGTTGDADTWKQFDNTPLTGQANIANIFGSNYLSIIRDWATSVFSDDVPGVTDARFIEQSWNMRSIFPNLCANSACTTRLGRFPLAVVPLSDASPANLTLRAGGEAYLRFSVAAGTNASIDWSAAGTPVSSQVKFTVVRSK